MRLGNCSSIAAIGLEATRQRWETHWHNALSDEEISFLAYTAHITTVRLPIGYFTLGSRFTADTPFAAPGIADVYTNAWSAVLRLCERLCNVGVGVLLDLHALPGGVNTEEHGGVSSGKAEMLGHGKAARKNRELAKECVLFMAREVKGEKVKSCAGIELCNEASWDAEGLYPWYEDAIKAVGAIDETIPLYVSDGWDLSRAVQWCGEVTRSGRLGRNPIVVDTHRYYTFTSQDRSQTPQQIISRVRSELDDVQPSRGSVVDKGAIDIIIGEWSCVIDGASWARAGDGADKDALVRELGKAQCDQWRKNTAGSFFWTAKMQWMDGGEWGLFEMAKKGAVVPSNNLTLSFAEVKIAAERARRQRLDRKNAAVNAHVGFWDSTSPGGVFEHWRFEQGWELGYADALAFFEMRAMGNVLGAKGGADGIGCLEGWVARRLRETGQGGGLAWEWEHGFRQGVAGFGESVLVM